MATLTSNKIYILLRNITRDREGKFIMIGTSISQKKYNNYKFTCTY